MRVTRCPLTNNDDLSNLGCAEYPHQHMKVKTVGGGCVQGPLCWRSAAFLQRLVPKLGAQYYCSADENPATLIMQLDNSSTLDTSQCNQPAGLDREFAQRVPRTKIRRQVEWVHFPTNIPSLSTHCAKAGRLARI